MPLLRVANCSQVACIPVRKVSAFEARPEGIVSIIVTLATAAKPLLTRDVCMFVYDNRDVIAVVEYG